jgi:hypothetical protein
VPSLARPSLSFGRRQCGTNFGSRFSSSVLRHFFSVPCPTEDSRSNARVAGSAKAIRGKSRFAPCAECVDGGRKRNCTTVVRYLRREIQISEFRGRGQCSKDYRSRTLVDRTDSFSAELRCVKGPRGGARIRSLASARSCRVSLRGHQTHTKHTRVMVNGPLTKLVAGLLIQYRILSRIRGRSRASYFRRQTPVSSLVLSP